MKIVQINTFSNKSTGTIMMNIHKELLNEGYDSYVIWGRGRKPKNSREIYMNDSLGVKIHALMTRITDKTGFYSKTSTLKLINKLDEIKPDVVHLHNVHGYYINIEILFNYLKANNIKVIWTLHDCWSFTGHCPHFDYIKCDKWKEQCYDCPQIKCYPKSFVDNSKWNYITKKELFCNLNMTIVTPCLWLSKLIKESFLKQYNVIVINNGIDRSIFKETKSDFKNKYNLNNKKIILGVASDWTEQKGFNDFIELSKIIDNNTMIVMVGLNNKQLKKLPNNIIGIKRTENVEQLTEIYSSADVYFNPTYADTFPTTNLEALACNTPVITYNTGGSPESVKNNGYIIEKGNYKKVIDILKNIDVKVQYKDIFTKENMIKKYIELYKEMEEK